MTVRRDQLAAALYGFVLVAVVAGSSGGFGATTWGWTAVFTLWLAAITLLLYDQIEVGAPELAYVGAIFAFTGWVALSNLWTPSVTSTMHEVQRNLAYVGVIAAGVLIVRRAAIPELLGGVLGGIVVNCLYGLGTRLLPDRLGVFDSTSFGYRLSAPITYWNGLGIFATLGLLLAIGFAARGRHLASRGLAAAVTPLLVATMYFTFSRGAWYALALGLVVAVALDPRRIQFIAASLALIPWAAIAVLVFRRQHGLETVGASFDEARHDGHRLAVVLLVLAVAAAGSTVGLAVLERRLRVPQMVRRGFVAFLVAGLAVGFIAVWVQRGSPDVLAHRAWKAFHTPPRPLAQGDIGNRLFSLSAGGRVELWHVSMRDFDRAPILGQGAGTFWQDWARYRPIATQSTQAHSLYLGTMGELGAVGLVLILVLVLVPLGAAARVREIGLVPATAGAYAASAAHSGIDWDWALLGVTAPVLLAGVALAKFAGEITWRPAGGKRWVVAAAVAAPLLFATPVLIADLRLRTAEHDAVRHPSAALSAAASAKRFAPWSSEPYTAMATIYSDHRQPSRARNALHEAIQRDSTSWMLWLQRANHNIGAPRRAAELKVMELNPLLRTAP